MSYRLPADVAPCMEPRDILSGDHRKVPHVSELKAKVRSIGFRLKVATGDTNVGKTRILLGFLPAGRNRVLFELSAIDGSGVTITGGIKAGEYLIGGLARIRVPEHAITDAVTLGDMLSSLSKNPGDTTPGDGEFSRPSYGFAYNSLENIPLYVDCSALVAGNELYGQILYGQE